MPSQTEIHPHTLEVLGRERLGTVIWSDVFAETLRLDSNGDLEPDWWRYHPDTDAVIASRLGNSGAVGMLEVPIGYVPWESIGLLQLDNRLRAKKCGASVIAIANRAPRNDDTVKDGANGEPYRMAVTESGLVVFASHYEALSDLAHGGRITAVYEVPGSNSVYKPHEQFRSAGVAEMVNYPQELVPLYQYGSALERNRAIARGDHNEPIPVVEDGFAYVDRFGNGIVRTSDMEPLIALDVGKMATLLVASRGIEHRVKVRRGIDLRSANVGEITVYPNLSDGYSSGAGIFEVMVRVNGDPSHSRETAVYALMKQVPGLDVRTASARLVV